MSIVIAPTLTQRELRWTDWKAMSALKILVHQHHDDGTKYCIWGVDCSDAIITYIYKGTVPEEVIASGYSQAQNDADKAEFESDYLPTSNRTNISRMLTKVGIGVDSLRPRTLRFTAAANSTTNHYFLMDVPLAFRGGYFWSNGQFGDYIRLSVTDKDNLLGYGVDFEIKEYIVGLSVIPSAVQSIVDVNVSGLITAGFYFKIEYTNSHATNSANCVINFLSYVAEE